MPHITSLEGLAMSEYWERENGYQDRMNGEKLDLEASEAWIVGYFERVREELQRERIERGR